MRSHTDSSAGGLLGDSIFHGAVGLLRLTANGSCWGTSAFSFPKSGLPPVDGAEVSEGSLVGCFNSPDMVIWSILVPQG